MSGYIQGAVWRSGPTERNQRTVLLALADNANDEGFCYPSIEHLVLKTLFSKRNVLYMLKRLEAGGWLQVNHKDLGRNSSYNINLDKLTFGKPTAAPQPSARKKTRAKPAPIPEVSTPPPEEIGANDDTAQVQTATPIGANDDIPPHPLIGEPSGTVMEPSPPPAPPAPEGAKLARKRSAKERSAADERWAPFRQDLKKAWEFYHPGDPQPWAAEIDGKAFSRWLRHNPNVTREMWQRCLQNRAKSPVVQTLPLHRWIGDLLKFLDGPRDRFDVLIHPQRSRKHDEHTDLAQANRSVGERWLTKTGEEDGTEGVPRGEWPVLEQGGDGPASGRVVEAGRALPSGADAEGVRGVSPDGGVFPGSGQGDPVD